MDESEYIVINDYDMPIDIDVVRELMDIDIVIYKVEPQYPATAQEFFDLYCDAFHNLTGTDWCLNTRKGA